MLTAFIFSPHISFCPHPIIPVMLDFHPWFVLLARLGFSRLLLGNSCWHLSHVFGSLLWGMTYRECLCVYIFSVLSSPKAGAMCTSLILEVTMVVTCMLCLSSSFGSCKQSEGPAPWLCTKDWVSGSSGSTRPAHASPQRVSQQPRVCILEIVLAAGGIILR